MKIRIWMKWTLMAGLALVGLVLALGIILPRVLDLRQYQPQIEALVSRQLNRSFSVGAGMDVSVFPWVGLRLSQVKVENPDGFDSREMLSAVGFEIRLKLLPLIQRRFQVKTFVLEEAVLRLEVDGQGRGNWEGLGKQKSPLPSQMAPRKPRSQPIDELIVQKCRIRNATLIYKNARHQRIHRISQLNMALEDIRLDTPIPVDASGLFQGQAISLVGYVGPLGQWGEDGEIPLDLTLEALGDLKLRFLGRLFDGGKGLWGDVTLFHCVPRRWLGHLGLASPRDPSSLNHMAGTLSLSLRPGFIGLSNGHLSLDASRFSFAMGLHTRDGGDLRFDIELDHMDLDRYRPPRSVAKTKEDSSPVKNAASPASHASQGKGFWETMMLKGRFRAQALTLAGGRLTDIVVHAQGEKGRFLAQPLTLSAYHGSLDGDFRLDITGAVPRMDLELNLSDVQLGPWVADVTKQNWVEGRFRCHLDLSTRGWNLDQWKQSLSGRGEALLFNGSLGGLDRLDPTLKSLTLGLDWAKPMVFSTLRVPLGIEKGRVSIVSAHLKSSLVGLVGQGVWDLNGGRLDLKLTPTLEWDGGVQEFNRLFKGLSQ